MTLADLRDLLGPHEHALEVWSARPIQPVMRMLLRPQGGPAAPQYDYCQSVVEELTDHSAR